MNQHAETLMDTYLNLKTQADKIREEMDTIKAQLTALMPDGGEVLGHRISLVRGRVNWNLVRKAYPETDFPQLYRQETVLDHKQAEALIAPAQLNTYRTETTVSIR